MVRFLLVLVLILATDEVAAQDITVTPAGPPIASGSATAPARLSRLCLP